MGSFPCGSDGKDSTCNAGDLGLIPGLGRFPGTATHSSILAPMDRGAWQTTVHGAAKSQTQLNNFPIELSLILVDQSELCKMSHLVKSEESRLASSVLHTSDQRRDHIVNGTSVPFKIFTTVPKLHIFMLFEIFITISQLCIFMLKNDKGQRSPRNALCWAKVKVKSLGHV